MARSCGADPLPSWNDGKTKQSIIAFVYGHVSGGVPSWCERPAVAPASRAPPAGGCERDHVCVAARSGRLAHAAHLNLESYTLQE